MSFGLQLLRWIRNQEAAQKVCKHQRMSIMSELLLLGVPDIQFASKLRHFTYQRVQCVWFCIHTSVITLTKSKWCRSCPTKILLLEKLSVGNSLPSMKSNRVWFEDWMRHILNYLALSIDKTCDTGVITTPEVCMGNIFTVKGLLYGVEYQLSVSLVLIFPMKKTDIW